MASNVPAPGVPPAPAAEGEFPVSENPALTARTGTAETDSEKEKEQDTAHMHGDDKEDKCGRPTAFETYLGQRPGRRS